MSGPACSPLAVPLGRKGMPDDIRLAEKCTETMKFLFVRKNRVVRKQKFGFIS